MSSEPERRNVTIRRAPKIIPFLVIGALLGIIGAAVIAFTGPDSSDFSRGTVFGFFSALLVIPGLLLGAIAALIFDWMSVRRSRSAVVESIEEDPEPESVTGTGDTSGAKPDTRSEADSADRSADGPDVNHNR